MWKAGDSLPLVKQKNFTTMDIRANLKDRESVEMAVSSVVSSSILREYSDDCKVVIGKKADGTFEVVGYDSEKEGLTKADYNEYVDYAEYDGCEFVACCMGVLYVEGGYIDKELCEIGFLD